MERSADFSRACIWVLPDAPELERKAAAILAEEIEKRTGISLPTTAAPLEERPFLYVGSAVPELLAPELSALPAPGREGFRLLLRRQWGAAVGSDPRGTLYAVGRLLRRMKWDRGLLAFPEHTEASAPRSSIRGHQLGYRPLPNAYDAWTPEIYAQYIRELALFGANGIELIPPCVDASADQSLMKLDRMEMTRFLSRTIHSYGMDVWVWYPHVDEVHGGPQNPFRSDRDLREFFGTVPYVDHVFIPGGDPGSLDPEPLFAWAEHVAALLRQRHPAAKLWISPQTGTPSARWVETFYALTAAEPEWLSGIVFAPWERDPPETLRRRIPARYPIRNYPDITHLIRCQYPVPQWDTAWALTLGREATNPRPMDEKRIHNRYAHCFSGSICYSEGINDDVNKFIWLDQEWNAETPALDTLRDYCGLFIDWNLRDDLAQGLLGEEEALRGPLAQNPRIPATLSQWQTMETQAGPFARDNYRMEMGLIRAYYDAYQQERLCYERYLEQEARRLLAAGADVDAAERVLLRAREQPIRREWRDRINGLADRLFAHIGAQLTVSRPHAAGYERGAYVDAMDVPLNDSRYLRTCFQKIRGLASPEEKRQAIRDLLHRTDPGPGGFYDSFESFGSCWQRLSEQPDYENDPAYWNVPLPSFLMQSPVAETDVPLAWRSNIYTLYQKPLVITYRGLDPESDYWYQAAYGRYQTTDLSLHAGEAGEILLHGPVSLETSFCTVSLKLPREAYASGTLILRLTVPDGQRGPNVSEILLTKRPLTRAGQVKIEHH